MSLSLTLPKRIIVDDNNIIQSTKAFIGLNYTKTLSANETETIKKFNSFDEEVTNANLDNVVTASQNAYFLYDNQNIIRETFISELKKQVFLIGGISFFDKVDKISKMNLIETIDKMKFDVRKNKQISHFDFNLSPARANVTISYLKKETNNIMIIATEKLSKLGQKRKMTEIAETILIKALQKYDNYTVLNPLEIDLRSNYLNQKINEYKGSIFEVILKNLLLSSSITNDTQNIFITCKNLNSAKKALINGKIYNILAIINLSEIKSWKTIKGNSIYVNAKIDDSHYMENAKHFGFKFETSYPVEILEFTCEFLHDKANKIEFTTGKEKIPSLDIQIDILK